MPGELFTVTGLAPAVFEVPESTIVYCVSPPELLYVLLIVEKPSAGVTLAPCPQSNTKLVATFVDVLVIVPAVPVLMVLSFILKLGAGVGVNSVI